MECQRKYKAMAIRTKRGAWRRYNALLKQVNRDMFGADWPTLRICQPEIYHELKDIQARYNTLPA